MTKLAIAYMKGNYGLILKVNECVLNDERKQQEHCSQTLRNQQTRLK